MIAYFQTKPYAKPCHSKVSAPGLQTFQPQGGFPAGARWFTVSTHVAHIAGSFLARPFPVPLATPSSRDDSPSPNAQFCVVKWSTATGFSQLGTSKQYVYLNPTMINHVFLQLYTHPKNIPILSPTICSAYIPNSKLLALSYNMFVHVCTVPVTPCTPENTGPNIPPSTAGFADLAFGLKNEASELPSGVDAPAWLLNGSRGFFRYSPFSRPCVYGKMMLNWWIYIN